MTWPETLHWSVAAFVTLLLVACAEEPQSAVPVEEPSPLRSVLTPTPSPTPAADTETLELAYVDDRTVWVVRSNGEDKVKLLDAIPVCDRPISLSWSAGGDRLVCERIRREVRPEGPPPATLRAVAVFDTTGSVLLDTWPVTSFSWSPTGNRLAYGVASERVPGLAATNYYILDEDGTTLVELPGVAGDILWSPDGSTVVYGAGAGQVATYSVETGNRVAHGPELDRPLGWALGGRGLLVASRLTRPEVGFGERYEALLLDLDTGERTRLPQLDNGRDFWVSPDGWAVVFVSHPEPPGLRVLHLPMRAIRPVEDSRIAPPFPSHYIADSHLVFSSDAELIWLHADQALYRALIDGSGIARVADLASISVQFSPDLTKVAYVRPSGPRTLWTANLDGTDPHQIGPVNYAFAWRPLDPVVSDNLSEARSVLERFAQAGVDRDTATTRALLSDPMRQIFAMGRDGIPGVRLGQISNPCWYRYEILAFDERREPAGLVVAARLRIYQHFWPGDAAGGLPRSWEEDVRLAPTPEGWRITSVGPAINEREEPDEPHGHNVSACNIARRTP